MVHVTSSLPLGRLAEPLTVSQEITCARVFMSTRSKTWLQRLAACLVSPSWSWSWSWSCSRPLRILAYTNNAELAARRTQAAHGYISTAFYHLNSSRSWPHPPRPANTMCRKLVCSGSKTCFGPSTQGAGTKTHLEPRFCVIFNEGELGLECVYG